MAELGEWMEEVGAAITVTDAEGTIIAMNRSALAAFATDGGDALIGTNVLDCHPEPSRSMLEEMMAERRPHHYAVRKDGATKVIHQLPWFRDGVFAGFVELAVPVPGPVATLARD